MYRGRKERVLVWTGIEQVYLSEWSIKGRQLNLTGTSEIGTTSELGTNVPLPMSLIWRFHCSRIISFMLDNIVFIIVAISTWCIAWNLSEKHIRSNYAAILLWFKQRETHWNNFYCNSLTNSQYKDEAYAETNQHPNPCCPADYQPSKVNWEWERKLWW